ncbi:hypothetical protein PLESTF_001824700, partial [Pleodorina starrii]
MRGRCRREHKDPHHLTIQQDPDRLGTLLVLGIHSRAKWRVCWHSQHQALVEPPTGLTGLMRGTCHRAHKDPHHLTTQHDPDRLGTLLVLGIHSRAKWRVCWHSQHQALVEPPTGLTGLMRGRCRREHKDPHHLTIQQDPDRLGTLLVLGIHSRAKWRVCWHSQHQALVEPPTGLTGLMRGRCHRAHKDPHRLTTQHDPDRLGTLLVLGIHSRAKWLVCWHSQHQALVEPPTGLTGLLRGRCHREHKDPHRLTTQHDPDRLGTLLVLGIHSRAKWLVCWHSQHQALVEPPTGLTGLLRGRCHRAHKDPHRLTTQYDPDRLGTLLVLGIHSRAKWLVCWHSQHQALVEPPTGLTGLMRGTCHREHKDPHRLTIQHDPDRLGTLLVLGIHSRAKWPVCWHSQHQALVEPPTGLTGLLRGRCHREHKDPHRLTTQHDPDRLGTLLVLGIHSRAKWLVCWHSQHQALVEPPTGLTGLLRGRCHRAHKDPHRLTTQYDPDRLGTLLVLGIHSRAKWLVCWHSQHQALVEPPTGLTGLMRGTCHREHKDPHRLTIQHDPDRLGTLLVLGIHSRAKWPVCWHSQHQALVEPPTGLTGLMRGRCHREHKDPHRLTIQHDPDRLGTLLVLGIHSRAKWPVCWHSQHQALVEPPTGLTGLMRGTCHRAHKDPHRLTTQHDPDRLGTLLVLGIHSRAKWRVCWHSQHQALVEPPTGLTGLMRGRCHRAHKDPHRLTTQHDPDRLGTLLVLGIHSRAKWLVCWHSQHQALVEPPTGLTGLMRGRCHRAHKDPHRLTTQHDPDRLGTLLVLGIHSRAKWLVCWHSQHQALVEPPTGLTGLLRGTCHRAHKDPHRLTIQHDPDRLGTLLVLGIHSRAKWLVCWHSQHQALVEPPTGLTGLLRGRCHRAHKDPHRLTIQHDPDRLGTLLVLGIHSRAKWLVCWHSQHQALVEPPTGLTGLLRGRCHRAHKDPHRLTIQHDPDRLGTLLVLGIHSRAKWLVCWHSQHQALVEPPTGLTGLLRGRCHRAHKDPHRLTIQHDPDRLGTLLVLGIHSRAKWLVCWHSQHQALVEPPTGLTGLLRGRCHREHKDPHRLTIQHDPDRLGTLLVLGIHSRAKWLVCWHSQHQALVEPPPTGLTGLLRGRCHRAHKDPHRLTIQHDPDRLGTLLVLGIHSRAKWLVCWHSQHQALVEPPTGLTGLLRGRCHRAHKDPHRLTIQHDPDRLGTLLVLGIHSRAKWLVCWHSQHQALVEPPTGLTGLLRGTCHRAHKDPHRLTIQHDPDRLGTLLVLGIHSRAKWLVCWHSQHQALVEPPTGLTGLLRGTCHRAHKDPHRLTIQHDPDRLGTLLVLGIHSRAKWLVCWHSQHQALVEPPTGLTGLLRGRCHRAHKDPHRLTTQHDPDRLGTLLVLGIHSRAKWLVCWHSQHQALVEPPTGLTGLMRGRCHREHKDPHRLTTQHDPDRLGTLLVLGIHSRAKWLVCWHSQHQALVEPPTKLTELMRGTCHREHKDPHRLTTQHDPDRLGTLLVLGIHSRAKWPVCWHSQHQALVEPPTGLTRLMRGTCHREHKDPHRLTTQHDPDRLGTLLVLGIHSRAKWPVCWHSQHQALVEPPTGLTRLMRGRCHREHKDPHRLTTQHDPDRLGTLLVLEMHSRAKWLHDPDRLDTLLVLEMHSRAKWLHDPDRLGTLLVLEMHSRAKWLVCWHSQHQGLVEPPTGLTGLLRGTCHRAHKDPHRLTIQHDPDRLGTYLVLEIHSRAKWLVCWHSQHQALVEPPTKLTELMRGTCHRAHKDPHRLTTQHDPDRLGTLLVLGIHSRAKWLVCWHGQHQALVEPPTGLTGLMRERCHREHKDPHRLTIQHDPDRLGTLLVLEMHSRAKWLHDPDRLGTLLVLEMHSRAKWLHDPDRLGTLLVLEMHSRAKWLVCWHSQHQGLVEPPTGLTGLLRGTCHRAHKDPHRLTIQHDPDRLGTYLVLEIHSRAKWLVCWHSQHQALVEPPTKLTELMRGTCHRAHKDPHRLTTQHDPDRLGTLLVLGIHSRAKWLVCWHGQHQALVEPPTGLTGLMRERCHREHKDPHRLTIQHDPDRLGTLLVLEMHSRAKWLHDPDRLGTLLVLEMHSRAKWLHDPDRLGTLLVLEMHSRAKWLVCWHSQHQGLVEPPTKLTGLMRGTCHREHKDPHRLTIQHDPDRLGTYLVLEIHSRAKWLVCWHGQHQALVEPPTGLTGLMRERCHREHKDPHRLTTQHDPDRLGTLLVLEMHSRAKWL